MGALSGVCVSGSEYLTKILIGSLGDYVILSSCGYDIYTHIYSAKTTKLQKDSDLPNCLFSLWVLYHGVCISRQWITISVLFVGVSYLIDNKLRILSFLYLQAYSPNCISSCALLLLAKGKTNQKT